MADKKITCVDCEKEFVFTEAEQAYYAEHNLVEPKRCLDCRKARKAARKAAKHSETQPTPTAPSTEVPAKDTK